MQRMIDIWQISYPKHFGHLEHHQTHYIINVCLQHLSFTTSPDAPQSVKLTQVRTRTQTRTNSGQFFLKCRSVPSLTRSTYHEKEIAPLILAIFNFPSYCTPFCGSRATLRSSSSLSLFVCVCVRACACVPPYWFKSLDVWVKTLENWTLTKRSVKCSMQREFPLGNNGDGGAGSAWIPETPELEAELRSRWNLFTEDAKDAVRIGCRGISQ